MLNAFEAEVEMVARAIAGVEGWVWRDLPRLEKERESGSPSPPAKERYIAAAVDVVMKLNEYRRRRG